MTEKEKKGYEIVLKALQRDFPFIREIDSVVMGSIDIYVYCDYVDLCKFKGEKPNPYVLKDLKHRNHIRYPDLEVKTMLEIRELGHSILSMLPDEYVERREYVRLFSLPTLRFTEG